MLYFPQLITGAVTQYPISIKRRFRTIVSSSADGRTIKAPDYGVDEQEWDLHHSCLTDSELADLEAFFETTEGRLNSFTFLDPADNLLLWSEDLSKSVWTKGPMIGLSTAADPLGTARAIGLANSGGADQVIEQALPAPGWLQYCFSFSVRSTTLTQVVLHQKAGGQTYFKSSPVCQSWTKIFVSGALGTSDPSITFGLTLAAGQAIEVFGLQAEAQLNPSPYKPTTTRSGIYANARFAQDKLRIFSHHVNQHSVSLRIVAAPGS
jgi:hypothetical protein